MSEHVDEKTAADYEKQIYDLRQMLDIFRSLATTLELPKLIQSILYTAMTQLRVSGAGIFIITSLESNDAYRLKNNYENLPVDPQTEYIIPRNSLLIEKLNVANTVFTLEDLRGDLAGSTELQMLESLSPSLLIPLIFKNRVIGFLLLGAHLTPEEDHGRYSVYEKEQILLIASLAAIVVNNSSLVERSSTDMMTHLKLKFYFFNKLADKLDAARAAKQSLSVLMFDIDFFKNVNDTYGHACGDYVLTQVAGIIKGSVRSQDLAARYGGEEFTVFLHNMNAEGAMGVAERIRKKVEDFHFVYENQELHLTISVGVSEFSLERNPVASAAVLVDQADKALYVSKRSGRNRVTFADASVLAAAG